MALEEYRRKRDFKKTPEPPPQRMRKHKGELSYLIQKHDATRLHYDFRLELDGVLLSWAVTRGPSLNPIDKRLAVRTEDHPLSYGTFEGTIPKGQYGGGSVMMWDEGTWEPKGDPRAGLKKGRLSFILHGERLKGGWALIRMRGDGKRENWLLIKEKDEESLTNGKSENFLDDLAFSIKSGRTMDEIAAGTKKAIPSKPDKSLQQLMKKYPEVQLATLVDKPPEGDAWLHEIKFDGYRLLGFVANGAARLRTRNGNDWTEKFPAIRAALEKLKVKNAVLDMEAVVVNDTGKTSFQALKDALSEGGDTSSIIAYAFDLLHLDGKDLTGLSLRDRKKKLQPLLKKTKNINYSDHVDGHGDQMIARSCSMGLEGIVSKQVNAPYRPGRQKSWLKSKCGMRQEFIILGYSDPRKGERAMGALYLGYHKRGKLHYAGKVGTGFTMKSAREIIDTLDKLSVDKPVLPREQMGAVLPGEWGRIHWVKPSLLCEVAFTEWTGDGHVRHPSFQGLREDKSARGVKQEKPESVKKTAAKTKNEGLVLHGVTITHPDRVISETGHVTKGELAQYYAAVAPYLLPHIKRRPLTLLRCPSGLDGECFYQRNPGKGLGPDVQPFHFRHKGKKYEYLYIEDAKGLMELVQMGAIELHPWGSTIDDIDHPDYLIFDLDPAPDVPFEAVKLAVQDLGARLEDKGMKPRLKCTGGKGLHVIIPLDGKMKWPEAKEFARAIAQEMVRAAPEAYIATMSKAKRTGKIFIDFFRNDYTATAIADYAVRARPGAPVALPLEWRELKNLKSGNGFDMKTVLRRILH